jgi:hypothetical protein
LIGRGISPPPPIDIAQQYSTATFVSPRFHFCKENFGASFTNVVISGFFSLFLKLCKSGISELETA